MQCAEHLSEVLKRPSPEPEADRQEAVSDQESDFDINIKSPSKEEIISATKTLKNGKAPGEDSLNA